MCASNLNAIFRLFGNHYGECFGFRFRFRHLNPFDREHILFALKGFIKVKLHIFMIFDIFKVLIGPEAFIVKSIGIVVCEMPDIFLEVVIPHRTSFHGCGSFHCQGDKRFAHIGSNRFISKIIGMEPFFSDRLTCRDLHPSVITIRILVFIIDAETGKLLGRVVYRIHIVFA